MTFTAAAGHACGTEFSAATHLERHPELAWERPVLRDLPGGTWTVIRPE